MLQPISSLKDRLDSHYERYQLGTNNKDSYWGLGSWYYTFPDEAFEGETRELIFEISLCFRNIEFKEKVQRIFFDVVPILENLGIKNEIYRSIGEDKELQNYLDEDVARYRREKREDKTLVNDLNHQLDRRIAKARLAVKLGFLGESAGTGMSGATFLQTFNGKKLGLFKASNEHQSYWKTIHDGPIRKVLHNQPFYLSTHSKAGVQAEVAAYIISTMLNLNLVLPTKLTRFDGIEGSFQLMVPKVEGKTVVEFEKIRERFDKKTLYSSSEIQAFQLFAIFDYVTGNLDRHHRNWFVAYGEDGRRLNLHRIYAIDHDRCFLNRNPSSILALRSQYLWRTLKIARQPMTHKTKRFIQNNLQKDQVTELMNAIEVQVEGFFTRESKARLQQRALVLQILANNPDEITLEGLGNLRSDRDIQLFLSY